MMRFSKRGHGSVVGVKLSNAGYTELDKTIFNQLVKLESTGLIENGVLSNLKRTSDLLSELSIFHPSLLLSQ